MTICRLWNPGTWIGWLRSALSIVSLEREKRRAERGWGWGCHSKAAALAKTHWVQVVEGMREGEEDTCSIQIWSSRGLLGEERLHGGTDLEENLVGRTEEYMCSCCFSNKDRAERKPHQSEDSSPGIPLFRDGFKIMDLRID